MATNRIELPTNCFLLYTNLVLYCKYEKKHEPFEIVLARFSSEIFNRLEASRDDYLIDLATAVNKIDDLKCFYGKITSEIRKHNPDNVSFNSSNDIAACFRFIVNVYPEYCSEGIQRFISEHLKKVFGGELTERTEFGQHQTLSEKVSWVNKFSNTIWYFYYHEYENSPKTRLTIISRLVLEIVSPNQLYLYEKSETSDFAGSIDLKSSTQSIIVINLETRYTNIEFKKLQLRILPLVGVSDNSIILGQYIDGETGNKIVSGTFVMENAKGHAVSVPTEWNQPEDEFTRIRNVKTHKGETLKVVRLDLVYHSGWERFIPESIAMFLSHKGKNHTKINPKISDYESLKDFLKDQRGKPEKYNNKIEYDMLIVTPIGNINEISGRPYYQEINQFFFKYLEPVVGSENDKEDQSQIFCASDILKKGKINRIYYTPRVALVSGQIDGDVDSETIINNEIIAMKSSRVIVFILPKLDIVNTSFFIKVGWAMKIDRPIIIFPLEKDLLPRLIDKHHIGKSFWISSPINIAQIPGRIVADYAKVIHM